MRASGPPVVSTGSGRRNRWVWGMLTALTMSGVLSTPPIAAPFVPASDAEVLADLPAGAHHAGISAQHLAQGRLEVAVPLAQFYIGQARASGDLRFLGYAEAVLTPWVAQATPVPDALVLWATVQQSRHEFAAALQTLDRSLAVRPDDPQAWLTRATVLRVLGRYSQAADACTRFAQLTDSGVGLICVAGIQGVTGQLERAYRALTGLSTQGLLDAERAWREAELGEMAVRLGRDADAEHWFQQELAHSPNDFYVRAAYADLLLRRHRDADALALLKRQESIEPLLLRIAIAQKRLRDPQLKHSSDLLEAAFAAEAARGEPVHRREQARFLLEVLDRPQDALAVALVNWTTQREPDDALVLVSAARAAGVPQQGQPALDFARAHGLLDVRLVSAGGSTS